MITLIRKAIRELVGQHNLLYIRSLLPDRAESEFLQKRVKLYSRFLKKGDLYFDVGANLGNRITPVLQIGARVIAVDPQDVCNKFLKKKFGNRITLIKKGLAEKAGTRDFYVSSVHLTSSFSPEWIESVKNSNRFKNRDWSKKVLMEMTTLDELVNEYGVPDFLKIDVEGYELEVLKGLSHPVRTISFEYTVPEFTERLIQCIQRIEEINKNISCNYSVGESMELEIENWIPAADMIAFVQSEKFLRTGFGDVYIRANL